MSDGDGRFGGIYAGRRVLVTGATGFKGAWLTAWLDRLGADVRTFGLPAPTTPSLWEECRLSRRIPTRTGDVRDLDAVTAAVAWAVPDVVFHLAAQALVLASYADPVATFATNVTGTVHLLEALRRCSSGAAVVVVTTDKVYEPAARAHVEGDRLGGHDPYSASKACVEVLVDGWRHAFPGPPMATARAGNVIGGGDWSADRIVPDLARAVAGGGVLPLRHPDGVRPWQHVLEPLSGYLLLGQRLLAEPEVAVGGWNFGPDPSTARSVRGLVDELLHRFAARGILPAVSVVSEARPERGAERVALLLDSTRAAEQLDWRPLLSFAETVDLTAAFYSARLLDPGFAADAVVAAQIAAYERLAAERGAPWASPPARPVTAGAGR